jgi:hypothetical protein
MENKSAIPRVVLDQLRAKGKVRFLAANFTQYPYECVGINSTQPIVPMEIGAQFTASSGCMCESASCCAHKEPKCTLEVVNDSADRWTVIGITIHKESTPVKPKRQFFALGWRKDFDVLDYVVQGVHCRGDNSGAKVVAVINAVKSLPAYGTYDKVEELKKTMDVANILVNNRIANFGWVTFESTDYTLNTDGTYNLTNPTCMHASTGALTSAQKASLVEWKDITEECTLSSSFDDDTFCEGEAGIFIFKSNAPVRSGSFSHVIATIGYDGIKVVDESKHKVEPGIEHSPGPFRTFKIMERV